MTPEERQLLAGLFDRTRAASANHRDPDAEAFIADAVRQQPYAPYLLAQTVIVQEQALQAANQRLQELEARVHELEEQASKPQQGGFLGGLGSTIFGSPSQAERPRSSVPSSGSAGTSPWTRQNNDPYPQAAAPQQPSPWQQGGYGQAAPQQASGSFLKGALGAAAGVAGGVLLANSISGLFSGHNNSLGIGSGLGNQSNSGSNQGFDPLPSGRMGDAQPATYDQALADRQQDAEQDAELESDDCGSSWDSGDDTTDV